MRFSERYGYSEPKVNLTPEDMPVELRAAIWDVIKSLLFSSVSEYEFTGSYAGYDKKFDIVTKIIWAHFFRKSIDDRPYSADDALSEMRRWMFKADFFKVYNFIEFLLDLVSELDGFHGTKEKLIELCNFCFERDLAAFRIIDSSLVQITDENQISEVSAAINQNNSHSVSEHTRNSAILYSRRPNPDYRNSIKESISAVEAAVQFVSNKKSVGVKRGLSSAFNDDELHPALRDGFEKLYAYSSDANGIRHALLEKDNLDQADARYMLVSCSAFSNYLLAKKKT